MVLTDAFDAMHSDIDFLAWAELRDEDVGVGGADGVGSESGDLLAGGVKDDIACVDGGIGVQLVRVSFRPGDTGDALAGGGQVEDDGVVISGVLWGVPGGGFCGMSVREWGGEE